MMADPQHDPTMPKRPPIAALKAIEQIKAYRSWAPIDLYLEIREALQKGHEYPQAPSMPGSGEPPAEVLRLVPV